MTEPPNSAVGEHVPVKTSGRAAATPQGKVSAKKPKSAKQESHLAMVRRARRINRELAEIYPDAQTELDFTNPRELSVATIRSAQCTDKRVNLVTPALFARYRSAKDFAEAKANELEKAIQSTGFFRNKAKSIRAAAAVIESDHKGKVPKTMAELKALPGVGRKHSSSPPPASTGL